MAAAQNVRQVGDRIEALLADLRAEAESPVRETAEELVRLLAELYGAGLERIVELIVEEPAGPEILGRLTDDQLVASLLLVHGLHPVDINTRVERALDKVRPYLGSHAGGVQYLGVDEAGVAHLRLQGSCHGCPSSTITVKLAIEKAIEEAAPDLAGIEVEGVAERPPAHPLTLHGPRRNGAAAENGHQGNGTPSGEWVTVDGLTALGPGDLTASDVAGTPIIVCRVDGSLLAYRNGCPSCGTAWTGGALDDQILGCPVCQERFDVRLAGRSLNGREYHLDPLPLLATGHTVRIAIPGAVA